MTIERVIIRNFKGLKETNLTFGKGVNILVGDNETGKSTVLEAINLALTKQLNRRDAGYELHPFLFHQSIVKKFVQSIGNGKVPPPLEIDIEVYFTNDTALAEHKGTNNSCKANCPGVRLRIELDDNFREEYQAYARASHRFRTRQSIARRFGKESLECTLMCMRLMRAPTSRSAGSSKRHPAAATSTTVAVHRGSGTGSRCSRRLSM